MKELQHGHRAKGRESPTYHSWKAMLKRCRNPNHKSYANYGGRGVTVCNRWDPSKGGSFANFLADMGERPDGKSLDKDIRGGVGCLLYAPDNCCWATRSEQNLHARKRRSTVGKPRIVPGTAVTIDGETQSRAGWCRAFGISYAVVNDRLKNGWGVVDAIITPAGKPGRPKKKIA